MRGVPSFASGGAVPAILHAGEGVVTTAGMRRIGRAGLDAVNRGGRVLGDVHIHLGGIHAIDARSFAEFLSDGGLMPVLRQLREAVAEGY